MPMRRAEDVLALHRAGRPVKYLCFWGHRPRRDGTVGQSCLSQWWPAPFTVDGRHFPTAEHWMMWRKALLFGDTEAGERVLAAAHPHRAKAIGREVRHFDPAVWEAERYAIVLAGSLAKFGQHADLRAYLLGTGERVLVEASPVDRVWGVGLAADDPRAEDPARWRGLNLLGFALMEARGVLRDDRPARPDRVGDQSEALPCPDRASRGRAEPVDLT